MSDSSRRVFRSASLIPIHDYKALEFWDNDDLVDFKRPKGSGTRNSDKARVSMMNTKLTPTKKAGKQVKKKERPHRKVKQKARDKDIKTKHHKTVVKQLLGKMDNQNTEKATISRTSASIDSNIMAMVSSLNHSSNLEISEINEHSEISDIIFEQDIPFNSATDSQILQEQSLNATIEKNLPPSDTESRDKGKAHKLSDNRDQPIDKNNTSVSRDSSTNNYVSEQCTLEKDLLRSKVHKFEELTRALQEEIKAYEREIERNHQDAIAKVNEYYFKLRQSHKQHFNECLQLVQQQIKSHGVPM